MTYCIIMLGDCALRLEMGEKTTHIRGHGGKFFLPAPTIIPHFAALVKGEGELFGGNFRHFDFYR